MRTRAVVATFLLAFICFFSADFLLHGARRAQTFSAIVNNDPLFALTAPPEEMRSALDSLRMQLTSIENHYPYEDRRTITDTFASLDFLSEAIDVSHARAALEEEPSYPHALTYTYREMRALSEHQRAIAGYQRALATIEPTTIVVFFDGTTTPSSLIETLERMDRADNLRWQNAWLRLTCLLPLRTCTPKHPSIPIAHEQPVLDRAQTTVNAHAIRSIKSAVPGYASYQKLLLFKNACARNPDAPAVVWHRMDSGTSTRYAFTDSLDVLNLDTASKNPPHIAKLFAAYREAGIHVVYESSGNAYLCLRSGYDIAAIDRMRSAIEMARYVMMSTSSDLGDHKELAQKLLGTIVSEYDTSRFADEIAGTFTATHNVYESSDTQRHMDEFLSRYRSATAYFDETLRGLMLENDFLAVLHHYGGTMPLPQLIVSRGYPLILLLGFQEPDDLSGTRLDTSGDRLPHELMHYFDSRSNDISERDLIFSEKELTQLWNRAR